MSSTNPIGQHGWHRGHHINKMAVGIFDPEKASMVDTVLMVLLTPLLVDSPGEYEGSVVRKERRSGPSQPDIVYIRFLAFIRTIPHDDPEVKNGVIRHRSAPLKTERAKPNSLR